MENEGESVLGKTLNEKNLNFQPNPTKSFNTLSSLTYLFCFGGVNTIRAKTGYISMKTL